MGPPWRDGQGGAAVFEQLEVLKFYLYYRYFLPKNRCFRNRKALLRRQKRRLRRHLRYVAEHSPLYRGMKKFSSYPVIDKAFMMEHFYRLNTVGISREEAEAFPGQQLHSQFIVLRNSVPIDMFHGKLVQTLGLCFIFHILFFSH